MIVSRLTGAQSKVLLAVNNALASGLTVIQSVFEELACKPLHKAVVTILLKHVVTSNGPGL